MSTHLKTIKGRAEESNGDDLIKAKLYITRFFGGEKHGAMLQLTIESDGVAYIQLTQKQVKKLAKVLSEAFDYDKYPSE